MAGPIRPHPIPGRALAVGAAAGLAGSAALLLAGLIDGWGVLAGCTVLVIGLGLVGRYRRSTRLGLANAVTLARLVGLSWIAALTGMTLAGAGSGPASALIVVVAAAGLVLDGVDGRLARGRGEASAFGARFDMETDAAMLALLSVAAAASGATGWWVLVIGGLRYAYWLTSFAVPALRRELPPSTTRKAVAVSAGIALSFCLAWPLTGLPPAWLPSLVAGLALAGLLWSFASVTLAQVRQGPVSSAGSSSRGC